jgi:F-box and WD-40 domain protein 1/11
MNSTHRTSRHRRYHSYDNPGDNSGFSQSFATVLGSPFLTTSDLPTDAEFVDGTPVYVPYTQTITRPSSPTPTVDSTSFSFVHPDPDMPRTPFKSILPRLWHVISQSPGRSPNAFLFPNPPTPFSNSLSKGKGKARHLDGLYGIPDDNDYTDLPPLDGEEGELITIDDEACFFNDIGYGTLAVTGIGMSFEACVTWY